MYKKILIYIHFLTVLTFLTPLVLALNTFIFPFVVPKIIVFRSLVIFLFIGYILLCKIKKEEFALKKTPLLYTVLFFFCCLGISTFLGVDWYKSFWDNHERMLGFFTLVHYGVFFLVLSSVFKTAAEWKILFRWFLGAGSIVMLLGFWQYFVDTNFLLNGGSARVSATLGNAIYYSGYGLFLFFAGLILFVQEKHVYWKIYAAIGSILGFVGIFLGGTRGAILGLMAGLVCLLVLYAWKNRADKKIRLVSIVLGVVLCGTLIGGFMFKDSKFVKSIPGFDRLVSSSLEKVGTTNTRIMAWGIAVDAWKERPVFGWGPNNFVYAFNQYYRPEFLHHGYGETWFDNAHSMIFNILTTLGAVGLLSYCVLFLVAFWVLYLLLQKNPKRFWVYGILGCFFVAHFVHNAFAFENPTSYIYFFFLLAFLESEYVGTVLAKKTNKTDRHKFFLPPFVFYLGVCSLLVFFYTTDILPARANMATLSALREFNVRGSTLLFNKALSIPSPHVDDIRGDIARTVLPRVEHLIRGGDLRSAKVLVDMLLHEIEKNLILHPKDVRLLIGKFQILQQSAYVYSDEAYFVRAIDVLESAIVYSPKRQQLYFVLAELYLKTGRPDKAVAILEKVVEDGPTIRESWWKLVTLYNILGKKEDAVRAVERAKMNQIQFSEEQVSQIQQMIR